MSYPRTDPRIRLGRLTEELPNGCVVFTGARYPNGYGNFWDNGRNRLAHRVAYELYVGPIPEGMTIDHVAARGCRHRNCVNPEHLEAVPLRENILRGNGTSAHHARKSHCLRGHAFTPENTHIGPKGDRECRACRHVRCVSSLTKRQRETLLSLTNTARDSSIQEAHWNPYGAGEHSTARALARRGLVARAPDGELYEYYLTPVGRKAGESLG